MNITVLFFANLRDLAQVDSISVNIDGVKVVRDLLIAMRGHVPDALVDALLDESAMVSINQRYAGWDGALNDGDEVGMLPPVSGG